MNFEPGTPFTINSRKYDGTIRRSWKCEFVAADGDSIDLVGRFEAEVEHPDLGRIEAGTVSHERFYLHRWYNYFRFEHPAGNLRNYYINICMPPRIAAGVIDYIDLDIDVIVWPDGRLKTLDLNEFEIHANSYGYPDDVRLSAMSALQDIVAVVSLNSGVDSELSVVL